LHIDETLINIQCPPMTLLTLVENAVRHGIDPSETGGGIAIDVRSLESSRCLASVTTPALALNGSGTGTRTGLASLRERLQLTFGAEAQLTLSEMVPHGVRAKCHFLLERLRRDGTATNCPDCRGRTAAARVSRTAAIAQWPELAVVARARNGREAIDQFEHASS